MTHAPRRAGCTLALLLAVAAPLAAVSAAQEITGKVVAIADGDTLTLLVSGNQQVRVRLTEIDTPERGQPYAEKSKQRLASMVFERDVRVASAGKDRFGRTLGRVFAGDVDVNAEMVRSGAAWVYRKYAKDPEIFELESQARAARRGIWSLPEADRVPPWEWRQKRR
jgi:endonuclease YncB( thermonuclease family)